MANIRISFFPIILLALVTAFARDLPENQLLIDADNSDGVSNKEISTQESGLLSWLTSGAEAIIGNITNVTSNVIGTVASKATELWKGLQSAASGINISNIFPLTSRNDDSSGNNQETSQNNSSSSNRNKKNNSSTKLAKQNSSNFNIFGVQLPSIPIIGSLLQPTSDGPKKKPSIPTHAFNRAGFNCSCQSHKCNCYVNALQFLFESSPDEIGCNVTVISFGYRLVTLPIDLLATPHVKLHLFNFQNHSVGIGFDVLNVDTLIVTNTACVEISLIYDNKTLISFNLGCMIIALDQPFKYNMPSIGNAIEIPGIPIIG